MSVDLFEEFLQIMKPIKNQIGSLIFQFEYLNRHKMSFLSEFQNHLHQFFTSLPADAPPMSIEISNPNYLNANHFRFLKDMDLSIVFLQGYFMPSVVGIYNKYEEHITD
jgi:hypothetical protein